MSDNQRQVYTTISARTEGAAGPGQAQPKPAAAGPTAREAQVMAMLSESEDPRIKAFLLVGFALGHK